MLPSSATDPTAFHRKRRRKKDFHYKAFKTPKETTIALAEGVQKKVIGALDRYLLLSISGGVMTGLAGLSAISVCGVLESPTRTQVRTILGLIFPAGLAMMLIFGGELFTGNLMYYTLGAVQRSVKLWAIPIALTISLAGNWAGTHLCSYLFGYLTDIFALDPHLSIVRDIAEAKASLSFEKVLLRGIPANFLVTMAFFMSVSAEDIASKIIALWIPIFLFASSGFEHCVANLFFVPLGIWYGADVTYAKFVYGSFIPSAIGNFIGGGIFVGGYIWYLYLLQEDGVPATTRKPAGFNFRKWAFVPKKFWGGKPLPD